MICKYCGADIQDGATFCASCGAAVEAGAASYEVPAEETVVYDATPVQAPSKTPLILGIVSMVCALLAPIGSCGYCCCGAPGLLLWIGSIVTAIISFVQAKKNGQKKNGFAIAGLIIAIAFVVLGAIGVILYIALYGFAAFTSILSSSGDYYY
jgi:hypothetical protein